MNKNQDEWIQEQCTSINEDMSRNRSNKRAYNTLKMLTKPNHKNMMIFFDNNYKPLADNNYSCPSPIGLMRRWIEYCNNPYNYPIKTNEELSKDTITSQHDISLPILL